MPNTNKNINRAAAVKNDEFYTKYSDIEQEIVHYHSELKDKHIYLPCDDYRWSNFWKYFYNNFHEIGLKKITSTHYDSSFNSSFAEYDGDRLEIKPLENIYSFGEGSNGDFRSCECKSIMKECDIVITNPPFSLYLEFIHQVINYKKKFILIGHLTSIANDWTSYKMRNDEIRIGKMRKWSSDYLTPENEEKHIPTLIFQNLKHFPPRELNLNYKFDINKYKAFENKKDTIEVSYNKHIPIDYEGLMAVPITYMVYHNPELFEIKDYIPRGLYVNGEQKFARFIIQRKRNKWKNK